MDPTTGLLVPALVGLEGSDLFRTVQEDVSELVAVANRIIPMSTDSPNLTELLANKTRRIDALIAKYQSEDPFEEENDLAGALANVATAPPFAAVPPPAPSCGDCYSN